jgi:hypothetical protein
VRHAGTTRRTNIADAPTTQHTDCACSRAARCFERALFRGELVPFGPTCRRADRCQDWIIYASSFRSDGVTVRLFAGLFRRRGVGRLACAECPTLDSDRLRPRPRVHTHSLLRRLFECRSIDATPRAFASFLAGSRSSRSRRARPARSSTKPDARWRRHGTLVSPVNRLRWIVVAATHGGGGTRVSKPHWTHHG